MTRHELIERIETKQSVLCVGLDPDLQKLPDSVSRDPQGVFDFCRNIIDATLPHAVAYKPNFAFFEAMGAEGYAVLSDIADYLHSLEDRPFTIADAKRGDIGNTAMQYAAGTLGLMGFDSMTIAPYMGKDSVTPFFMEGKWAIPLGLTSNPGANDLQRLNLDMGDRKVYEAVLDLYDAWGTPDQLMVVVGATRPELLGEIRQRMPDHFFLVPGVGAQGGTVADVMRHGAFQDQHGVGTLINVSRGISFASQGEDYAKVAGRKAAEYHEQMKANWPSI